MCEYPGNVESCNSQPEEGSGVSSVCSKDGYFSYGNCSDVFYACSNGRQIPMFCPAKLAFDESRQLCDYPLAVAICTEGSGESSGGSSGESSAEASGGGSEASGETFEEGSGKASGGSSGEGSGEAPVEQPREGSAEGSGGSLRDDQTDFLTEPRLRTVLASMRGSLMQNILHPTNVLLKGLQKLRESPPELMKTILAMALRPLEGSPMKLREHTKRQESPPVEAMDEPTTPVPETGASPFLLFGITYYAGYVFSEEHRTCAEASKVKECLQSEPAADAGAPVPQPQTTALPEQPVVDTVAPQTTHVPEQPAPGAGYGAPPVETTSLPETASCRCRTTTA
ncbi:chitin binding Peritrophin-A domain protein [Cooperia oncophora]